MKLKLMIFFLTAHFIGLGSSFAASSSNSPYIPLNPPLIVNVTDGKRVRHMQVSIQLKIDKPENAPHIENHRPAIRHELIMLLTGQDVSKLSSTQGKEALRLEAQTAVQKVLQEHTGQPGITGLYFTNLIIQ